MTLGCWIVQQLKSLGVKQPKAFRIFWINYPLAAAFGLVWSHSFITCNSCNSFPFRYCTLLHDTDKIGAAVIVQVRNKPKSRVKLWSGWPGSNRHGQLGRLGLYHWATPANWKTTCNNCISHESRDFSPWPDQILHGFFSLLNTCCQLMGRI